MSAKTKQDGWNSRLGVILAVAGSAVGLGNFLRFPGQAAEYGGGAFMVAYFLAFLLLGLPICWAEWTMGRHGGLKGFNSSPGIFNVIWRHPIAKYLGIIGVIIPVVIYMYYVYIEAWCLGYAVNFLRGEMEFNTVAESKAFWGNFIGISEDGEALQSFSLSHVGLYLLIVFAFNFVLIYRGVAKGIEFFCKIALPTLVVLAIIVLIRVLTLGAPVPGEPDENVYNGLGFMWNPTKTFLQVEEQGNKPNTSKWVTEREYVDKARIAEVQSKIDNGVMPGYRLKRVTIVEQLANPQLWLAAASQIFFSLSVGFGVIITYSSYLRRKDDIVLSGLSATSANEFCEVALGGLITLPAAVAFIGVSGLAGAGLGTFDLGFKVLPMVFSEMIFGNFFGFLWFFLLFLAAVTSSISMLQPGIAFLEETLSIERKRSVALLGLITAIGCGFVVYFSKDIKALDTMDFWVGTLLIFVLATIQIILFGWVFGIEKGFKEAHQGAIIRIPNFYRFIMKWISPFFLLTVFVFWVLINVFGFSFKGKEEAQLSSYVVDLFIEPNTVAWMSVGLIVALFVFFGLIVSTVKRYKEVAQES
ncbi:sodium:calcium symporter [Rubellicoccus peritrichatus]|uniref:Sodium:calcium symporter n=1 Tax=Rubellicoccus peritrichatus TaxID=3080537 RepID=A0AAQ3L5V0_9BACT|nr:sodium:calcium symporter [Puniceicoccus sp. CR14]WOO39785.1 sodium:calcium symporter [Puniceicoccus sp. CR14]